ncbi:TniQ family protein [Paenibacillus sp. MBLB2552]|uniref:TniQ family protein n=1 Tax=Paenibacillus mellifer TaxID=2937794 RepID=A0A9X1XZS5_9BACL|nr:TniQ family protein [Paenibacillus mellifer]MCK8488277.1 TniQ family protein [Paenibacillus mellifer]
MFDVLSIDEDKVKHIMDTRSRLYPLQPRGLGTAMKEGLVSYITRLSEAHCTDVGSLVSYECSPNFENPRIYSYQSNKVNSSFYKDAYTINCFGAICTDMEYALTKLTQRSDISEMNLNKWVFTPRNKAIVKKQKHWCIQCYSEWEKEGKALYDPLLWSIELIKICPVHKTLLQTSCSGCNMQIPIINQRSLLSHCIYCFKSLVSVNEVRLVESEDELLFQVWLCDSIGKLLMYSKEFVDTSSICNALQSFRENYCDNNDRVLSRLFLLENKRRQINAYCRGAANPHFNLLLWFCYVLGIELISVCTGGEFTQIERKPSELLQDSKKYFMLESKWSKIDKEIVREKLMDFLSNDHPRSFNSISRELDIQESYLRKMFPKESKLLTAKYTEYRTNKKNEKMRLQKEKIEIVLNDYYQANGSVPTISMLKKLLGNSHVTFKQELMSHYHDQIKEFVEKKV